jgi:hypothetical protein
MTIPVPLNLLKRLAPLAVELARSKAGGNPLVNQVISAASGLLGQHPDPAAKPVKQQLDAETADALASLRRAGEEARASVRYRPPGQP